MDQRHKCKTKHYKILTQRHMTKFPYLIFGEDFLKITAKHS